MKVGDSRSCPECRGKGKVVWISEDGKTIAVKCSKTHRGKKNTVFLIQQRISVVSKERLKRKWMQQT
jgi:hypothetical protein